ncbi:hypothetical protein DZ860_17760 [Vibrio sinensis]|uniref:3-demethylubiquinone-9 3-methyltransferase n=1 Tax=Vibrio sinensis TaxID=2302434 RepID=A0A3A6QKX2_9VIBR|nr:hypothetical protein [Vibrio sinensis]RJX68370.1 hypothetical protein DZ860_17760 [Vibrio sinensis]
MVESLVLQLQRDFYAHINSLQAYTLPQTRPTLTVLTEEELKELENVWVELSVWQRKQTH